MYIGLTFDLRDYYRQLGYDEETIAECDSEETINALEEAIRFFGHHVERIGNIHQLVEALACGKSWDLVFNIAEGLHGLAREAQVPALLDAYKIPYTFSTPDIIMACHQKVMTKQIVAAAGVNTASYAVVSSLADIAQVHLSYPLFVKPIAEGTGKGVTERSLVRNAKELRESCAWIIQQFDQAALVETYLPGREFTVGIIGEGQNAYALGALEVILNEGAEQVGHTYHNKEHCESLVTYRLCQDEVAKQAMEVALCAWRAVGCRDGGRIDIRCDENEIPHFLEINPLAGIHPTHSDLPILAMQVGMSYRELIGNILAQAEKRVVMKEELECPVKKKVTV